MKNKQIISEVLKNIRKLYSVAEKAKLFAKVENGYLSQNFILQNNDNKLFLKQYRFDDLKKIKEIHQTKFFFANGNIPVILPIQNKKGDFIFEQGKKFYSLFPFVEGRIIQRVGRSRKAFKSAGQMLAKIHTLTKNGHPDIIHNYAKGWKKEEFLSEAKTIKQRIEATLVKTDFDKLALDTLEHKLKLVSENNLRYEKFNLCNDHIIHGDYHGQNIFYDENDEVKYVFDIEKTKISPRVLEIARSMDFMCFSNNYEAKNFEDANTYLAAYNNIYPISKGNLIQGIKAYYLKKAHSLWIEREHYININLRVDCFLEGELLMLKYYSQNFDEFVGKLKINSHRAIISHLPKIK
ncbi:MAG: phosphotransferase [bacterium]|nr:phosphotransferase [bacterium]